jgi:hypothetical protein
VESDLEVFEAWSYFFLYPAGHLGLSEVTFFINFPLTQVIVADLEFGLVISNLATSNAPTIPLLVDKSMLTLQGYFKVL